MTPLFLDIKIISPEIKLEKKESNLFVRVRRSKFIVKIPLRLTKEVAYITGVILGDGNITITRRYITKYPRLKLRIFNSSESYLIKINNLFESVFGVKGTIYKKKYNNCFVLEINNKVVWLYFVKLIGIRPKRKVYLYVPKRIKNKDMFKHFLAGLFDTDGFLQKRGNFGIMMTGKNAIFLKNITKLSRKYYDLYFGGPYINKLIVNDKSFLRAQISLPKSQKEAFKKVVPLEHPKYMN